MAGDNDYYGVFDVAPDAAMKVITKKRRELTQVRRVSVKAFEEVPRCCSASTPRRTTPPPKKKHTRTHQFTLWHHL